jgi:hypothetical protein
MKGMKRAVFMAVLMGVLPLQGWAESQPFVMDVEVTVGAGSGDDPMIVVWLENTEGEFVKTLHMFSRDKKYYNDMLAWRFKSRKKENSADVDGVSGATISWKRSRSFSVPVKQDEIDLLDGSYVMRIESRKWKGKHYRNFKIPLTKGYKGSVHPDDGYVTSVKIVLKDKAE